MEKVINIVLTWSGGILFFLFVFLLSSIVAINTGKNTEASSLQQYGYLFLIYPFIQSSVRTGPRYYPSSPRPTPRGSRVHDKTVKTGSPALLTIKAGTDIRGLGRNTEFNLSSGHRETGEMKLLIQGPFTFLNLPIQNNAAPALSAEGELTLL